MPKPGSSSVSTRVQSVGGTPQTLSSRLLIHPMLLLLAIRVELQRTQRVRRPDPVGELRKIRVSGALEGESEHPVLGIDQRAAAVALVGVGSGLHLELHGRARAQQSGIGAEDTGLAVLVGR